MKEKSCKCCKQIWYVDMLHKKLKLCPNCYDYYIYNYKPMELKLRKIRRISNGK